MARELSSLFENIQGARCNSSVLREYRALVGLMCGSQHEVVTVEPSAEIVEAAKEQYETAGPEGDRREKIAEYVLDRVELEVRLGSV